MIKKYFDFIWICVWSMVLAASPVYGGPMEGFGITLNCKIQDLPIVSTITCLYFGSTPGNFEICDSPLLSSIKICKVQVVNRWTNDEIDFIVNLSGIPGLEKGYMYVTDSYGVTNVDGYPLTLGDYDLNGYVDGKDVHKLSSTYKDDIVSLQSLAGGFGK